MRHLAGMLALCVVLFTSTADSQTFKSLVQFTGTSGTANGENPTLGLAISGETLYGMTRNGGANGDGNVFSVGTDGSNFKNLASLTGTSGTASGESPSGTLILSGTTLYGMTSQGGIGYGNIFSIGTSGTNFRNLVSFTGTGGTANGKSPRGSLTLSGTTLYGMTQAGGVENGNVFSIGTGGSNFQNLVEFTGTGGTASGETPFGSLTINGSTLYGMTYYGGSKGEGNVFSVGTLGTNYTNLVSFTASSGTANGLNPYGSLTLSGTRLYGITVFGGNNGTGNIFSVGTNGTAYKNLISFTTNGGTASGQNPVGDLILSGSTLYGTAQYGGSDGHGDIFSLGLDGSDYQDLYDFTGGNDGGYPTGDLALSGGTLFGLTSQYGANGYGTVYALALPAPEPGTLALVGVAAVAFASYRWKRMLAPSPPPRIRTA